MMRLRYRTVIPGVYWLTVFSTYVWGILDHRNSYGAMFLTGLLTLPWCDVASSLLHRIWFLHDRALVEQFTTFFFFVMCCGGLNAHFCMGCCPGQRITRLPKH